MTHSFECKLRVTRWLLPAGWLLLAACVGPTEPPKAEEDIQLPDPEDEALSAGPLTEEELEDLRNSACASFSSSPIPEPHSLELVVDVSGSMSLPPDWGTEIKWHTTRAALRSAVKRLPSTTHLGAVFFPNQATESNCIGDALPCTPGEPLDVSACLNLQGAFAQSPLGAPDSEARVEFETALDAVNPAGGTPTHDAYQAALSMIQSEGVPAPRFLLLITDGQPTFLKGCSGSGSAEDPVDEQPVVDAIALAREAGVLTYVIGSPGSEKNLGTEEDARPWLSRAALAGGTARPDCSVEGPDYCHIDLSEEEDFDGRLNQELEFILGQISPCALSIPESPANETIDLDKINVVLHAEGEDPQILGRAVNEEMCEEGWMLSADGMMVELCETTCVRRRESSKIQLELLFGCESAPIRPPT